jgi:hypothetical protein
MKLYCLKLFAISVIARCVVNFALPEKLATGMIPFLAVGGPQA